MLDTLNRADLMIRDRAGNHVADVELKNRRELTRDVAVHFRGMMLAHRALSNVPFFLLLSQDFGYLWRDAAPLDSLAPPSHEFSMQAVITRYVGRERSSERVYRAEFAAIVFEWLLTLTQPLDEGQPGPGSRDEADRVLRQAGFVDAIRGGWVTHQDAG